MKNIAITFFGIFTSILVTAFLVFLEQKYEFSPYSLLIWLVIPAGAIISGAFAAVGYYLGAKILHAKPTPSLFPLIYAVSAFSYFLFYFINYQIYEIEGKPLSHVIGFGEYLHMVFTNTTFSLTRSGGDSGALGIWGYVFPILNIIGFSTGGFFMYWLLAEKPFCDFCEKFYAKDWNQCRYFAEEDTEKLIENVGQLAEIVQAANLGEVQRVHSRTGSEKQSKHASLRTELKVQKCPDCERRVVLLETQRLEDKVWTPVPDLSFSEILPGIKELDLV